MTMTFGEVVTRAYQRSRILIEKMIKEKKADGAKIYAEPALRDLSGNIVSAPDGLRLPLRYDLGFQNSGGRVETINADSSATNFREPVFATWEHKLKIEMHSISWDYMLFRLLPINPGYDWECVRGWFLKWFDSNDEKAPDENGLCGIVHFISDPVETKAELRIWVDLGSAPPDALAEFFDLLIQLGVETCRIGDPCDPAQFVVKE
jgi:hypothetical protein